MTVPLVLGYEAKCDVIDERTRMHGSCHHRPPTPLQWTTNNATVSLFVVTQDSPPPWMEVVRFASYLMLNAFTLFCHLFRF